MGASQNGWLIKEVPFKRDDLGVPPFVETPKRHFGRTEVGVV